MRPMEHYERWKQNCGILRIDVPASPEELCEITLELMRRNGFQDKCLCAAARVQVRGARRREHGRSGCVCVDRAAVWRLSARGKGTACGREFVAADRGQRHSGARQDLRGVCEQRAGQRRSAAQSGFDEAIFLNESGHVAEGATCNIFMVRKGKLITPPVTENVLEGITRDSVMELAQRELGIRWWSGPSTAASSMCATSCSSPGRRWELRRLCAWIIGRLKAELSVPSHANCSSCISMRRADTCGITGSGWFRFTFHGRRRNRTRSCIAEVGVL